MIHNIFDIISNYNKILKRKNVHDPCLPSPIIALLIRSWLVIVIVRAFFYYFFSFTWLEVDEVRVRESALQIAIAIVVFILYYNIIQYAERNNINNNNKYNNSYYYHCCHDMLLLLLLVLMLQLCRRVSCRNDLKYLY